MKKLQSQSGFTLSEVLIVVAILLILAGALVGFGKHLKQQAQASLCECTIGVLIAAIEQYYDWHEAFPDPGNNPVMSPIENLYDQLYSLPESRAICQQLESSLPSDTGGLFEFLDPWGEPFRYRYVVGQTFPVVISGMTFPVVESGGPDRDLTTAGDNISSR